MMAEALVTIASPKTTSAAIVNRRIQSVFSRWAILQVPYKFFENPSAVLVALELIEAGAGRCQQDDVARRGLGCRFLHGPVDCHCLNQRKAGKLIGNFG